MTHPLVDRLTTELGWPRFDDRASLDEWTRTPGVHVAFVPGDASRTLETPDVAVVLPELNMACQGAFACAVVGAAIDSGAADDTRVT